MTRIAQRITFSCPAWIIKDLGLDTSGNKSDRIQELMLKGYMAEKLKNKVDGVYEILTPDLQDSLNFVKIPSFSV